MVASGMAQRSGGDGLITARKLECNVCRRMRGEQVMRRDLRHSTRANAHSDPSLGLLGWICDDCWHRWLDREAARSALGEQHYQVTLGLLCFGLVIRDGRCIEVTHVGPRRWQGRTEAEIRRVISECGGTIDPV